MMKFAKLIMKKIKRYFAKSKRLARRIKKYFADIISEVVVEERATIKKRIASTFKNLVHITCTLLTAVAALFAIALVAALANKYNVSMESLKEICTAFNYL